MLVLVGAKRPIRIPVRAVNRCTGQSKQKSIGQRSAHLAAQVAFLRTMRLIHHHDNVRPNIQRSAGLGKLVDGGNQYLAHVLPKQRLQLLARSHSQHVGDVGRVECSGDLRIQVDTVHHDDDRGASQLWMHAKLQSGEDHQQRLAATLEMPDQAFLRIPGDYAGNDLVGGEVLLVAADDLDAAMFVVCGEERKVLSNV